ncbi:MAG TPA: hypothetical protein VFN35_20870 [Ktedonobacteraceae bacterium]|nr:hypothetical protein [Ktedonobacteraceae bacterium]
MDHSQSRWPPEQPEQLADLLYEQGASPEECADLLPTLRHLSELQIPQPSPNDTQRLFTRLALALPVYSPVRQAIREYRQHRIAFLLATARTQVSLFGLAFWLVSALITLVGAGIALSKVVPDQELILRASGPLLAYLGTIVAFRGKEVRVMELELVCLPSPLQLAIARLAIVLGYDICLSLALSLALWAGGVQQVMVMMLSWLMPLFLVTGLALLLSLRFSVQIAAALAYGSWLVTLAITSTANLQVLLLAPPLELLLGGLGLAGLAIALLCMHTNMHHLLPHS